MGGDSGTCRRVSADRLLFVYNAHEGLGHALLDAVHKMVAPASYPCSLCALTYGSVAMKRAWKAFLASLPQSKAFYHREDFARAYPAIGDLALPAILIDRGGGPELLVAAAELDPLPDLPALIALLDARLGRA
ncbi:MAG: hypothetical protein A4S16_10745 [Proteobacteria bacterium SG_bin6]|nr:MAG: hypothetical protein A4S16_10745 [Proteobacteria bacterium SG_bin6]